MLKILACACFISGSCGFGCLKVLEYKRRYEELTYIRYILNTLLLETQNRRGTFGESCFRLASKIKAPYCDIFMGLYRMLEKERKKPPHIYWEDKMKELAPGIPLKQEEVKILQGVIRCVDGTTPAMPIEVLRESIIEWDKVIRTAEQVRKERSKVTLCLSITVGLLLCITVI